MPKRRHTPYTVRMGEIIYDAATTLNGFIADEEHSLQWLFDAAGSNGEPPPGLMPENPSVYVMGANTYRWLLDYQPMLDEPEHWREAYGQRPCFVFAHATLPAPEGANIRFVSGDVAEHLDEIREAAADGDIWVLGGGALAGEFLRAGALDRICLSIAPAALASGAPLLPVTVPPARLRVEEAKIIGPFARVVFRVLPSVEQRPNSAL
ncbi:dihydrofolate reductase family protein [Glutamicibacter endophyticus]